MPPAQASRRGRSDAQSRMARIPADNRIAAFLIGAAMLIVWTWWALSDGAFFGTVLLPGGIVIYLVLIVVLMFARLPISTRGLHVLALTSLLGLAAWTALSVLWSPARDLAVDYAQRAALYAAVFALGLAFATALRRRMILSVAPLFIAGAITALVVVLKIWTTSRVGDIVDIDGTLDFPFGYRNANAGFFVMVAIASLPVVARPQTGAPARAGLAALASACLALAAISQSRGSMLALGFGLVVVLIASPNRGRAAVAALTAMVPVAIVFSQLLNAFDAAGTSAALDQLQRAATAAVIATVLAGALSATISAIEWQGRDIRVPKPSRGKVLTTLGAVAAVVLVIFVAVSGNPISSFEDRFGSISGNEDYGEVSGSRFTYSGGLDRMNYWDVAVGQAGDNPLAGGGAGSFRSAYLVNGDANGDRNPRNAHSLPLEMLGELGVVGLFLLCLSFVAACWAAIRSRRLGPEAAALSAVALAATASVLAQAMVDWSWYFGALIAPALALLGSASAPSALVFKPLPVRPRVAGAVAAAVLALIAVPAFASERLTLDAAENWRSDLDGAYAALGNAADLNPFAETPLLVESEVARLNGDRDRAVTAARSAIDRSPDDWRAYMLAAQALAGSDPEGALTELDRAEALNPDSADVARLRDRLLEESRE